MTKIFIDGNICSGKTFYLKLLEKAGYNVNYEQPMDFHNYCNDIQRYSINYHVQQIYKYPHYSTIDNEVQLFENSPYILKNVYGELLCKKNYFDINEYDTENIIIYLFCIPNVCYERSKNKNQRLSLDYLNQLHIKYEILCDEINCPLTLYKINSQEDSESVLNNIIEIIKDTF